MLETLSRVFAKKVENSWSPVVQGLSEPLCYNKRMTTINNSLVGLETAESRLALAHNVRVKAMALHELLVAEGRKNPHPWTRPRLYIETFEESYGLGYNLEVIAENGQSFTFSTEPELSLATHADSASTSYLVEFLLHGPVEEQGHFMQDDANAKAYLQAEKVLDQTIQAIKNNRPLDEHLSWRQALIGSLTKQYSYGIDADAWPHWFERWGTPQMAEAMNAATLLVDPLRNYDEWKAIVVSAWQHDALDSHRIPEDINDNFEQPPQA